jgi:AcrR family transcriptional regulator
MDAMPRPPRPLDAAAADRLRLAAADAFGAKGMDDASLNDILNRAAMGKGSFYHRFADKAALHDWVTRSLAGDMLAALRPPDLRTLTAASFRAELTAMVGRAAALGVQRPDWANLGLMFHNSAGAPPERAIAEVRTAVLGWIQRALTTGRGLGVIRSDLPADLLTEWTVTSLTTIDRWVLADPADPEQRARAATTALDALWTLLAPPAPAPAPAP